MSSYLISGGKINMRQEKISEIIGSFLGKDYLKSVDLKTINLEDGKKNISIDQIREINEFALNKPIEKEFKVVLINGAENLSIEAQNSMLKILEEPPSYLKFVLEASRSKSLLKTILSRCIVFELGTEISVDIDSSEHSSNVDEFIKLIIKDYGGRMDWAIENKETFLDKLNSWEVLLRDALLFRNNASSLFKNVYKIDDIEKTAGLFLSDKDVEDVLRRILRAKSAAKSNVNKSLIIEDLLVHLPINKNA
jgi:DNA polymerase III delta prime subunit